MNIKNRLERTSHCSIRQGERDVPQKSGCLLRQAVYFGTTPELWLNLQAPYNLKVSRRDLLPAIDKSVRPLQAVS
jgi:plasmid maintenance system antidote protein VapI